MNVQKSTTMWSANRKIRLSRVPGGQVDIRVTGGFQFLSLKELRRMLKALK